MLNYTSLYTANTVDQLNLATETIAEFVTLDILMAVIKLATFSLPEKLIFSVCFHSGKKNFSCVNQFNLATEKNSEFVILEILPTVFFRFVFIQEKNTFQT